MAINIPILTITILAWILVVVLCFFYFRLRKKHKNIIKNAPDFSDEINKGEKEVKQDGKDSEEKKPRGWGIEEPTGGERSLEEEREDPERTGEPESERSVPIQSSSEHERDVDGDKKRKRSPKQDWPSFS